MPAKIRVLKYLKRGAKARQRHEDWDTLNTNFWMIGSLDGQQNQGSTSRQHNDYTTPDLRKALTLETKTLSDYSASMEGFSLVTSGLGATAAPEHNKLQPIYETSFYENFSEEDGARTPQLSHTSRSGRECPSPTSISSEDARRLSMRSVSASSVSTAPSSPTYSRSPAYISRYEWRPTQDPYYDDDDVEADVTADECAYQPTYTRYSLGTLAEESGEEVELGGNSAIFHPDDNNYDDNDDESDDDDEFFDSAESPDLRDTRSLSIRTTSESSLSSLGRTIPAGGSYRTPWPRMPTPLSTNGDDDDDDATSIWSADDSIAFNYNLDNFRESDTDIETATSSPPSTAEGNAVEEARRYANEAMARCMQAMDRLEALNEQCKTLGSLMERYNLPAECSAD